MLKKILGLKETVFMKYIDENKLKRTSYYALVRNDEI